MKIKFSKYDLLIIAPLALLALYKYGRPDNDKPKEQLVYSGNSNGHFYVDLGLPSGKKWSIVNLTTTKGEWVAKTELNKEMNGILVCAGDFLTKNDHIKYFRSRKMDNVAEDDSTLFSDTTFYDIAKKMGEGWSTPSREEFAELIACCNWTWEKWDIGYVTYGFLGLSKINNNTIFFPANGYVTWENDEDKTATIEYEGKRGMYWTTDIASSKDYTFALSFGNETKDVLHTKGFSFITENKNTGCIIRPIYTPNNNSVETGTLPNK